MNNIGNQRKRKIFKNITELKVNVQNFTKCMPKYNVGSMPLDTEVCVCRIRSLISFIFRTIVLQCYI